jgi:hypothetical protein
MSKEIENFLTGKDRAGKINPRSTSTAAEIAQLVEHATENRSVHSPILCLGTKQYRYG